MSYHGKQWKERVGTLGDWAEEAFERIRPLGRYHELGWTRPVWDDGTTMRLGTMSSLLRHLPDYLCEGKLVECVGYGKDGILKFQEDKWDTLQTWDIMADEEVWVFIWNSHYSTYVVIRYHDLADIVEPECEIGTFHDGNTYWAIPRALLTSREVPYNGG